MTTATTMPRKAIALQDPEDMVLLREKLNQIAVGRRRLASGDNQLDHQMLDDHSDHDDGDAAPGPGGRPGLVQPQRTRAVHPDAGSGGATSPFGGAFLFHNDRPSTPPSSPQPRDVLRKQLRLKNPGLATTRRSLSSDNASDTASDEALEGMCVEGVEICPLVSHHGGNVEELLGHAAVRLLVPEHLTRAVAPSSSSFSVLSKCPEGFRKRKSVHIDAQNMDDPSQSEAAPLKKSSSQLNVLNGATLPSSGVRGNQEDELMMLDPAHSPVEDDGCPSCS